VALETALVRGTHEEGRMEERIAGNGLPSGSRQDREYEMHAFSTLTDKLIAHIYTQEVDISKDDPRSEIKLAIKGWTRLYNSIIFLWPIVVDT